MDESPAPQPSTTTASPTGWRVGPATCLLVLAFAVVDLLYYWLSHDLSRGLIYLAFLGFIFGQAAAGMIWVFSDQLHRRGLALLLAEIVSIPIAMVLSSENNSLDWSEHLLTLIIVLLHTHLVLGFMLLGQLLRHMLGYWLPREHPLWFPQFRLIHLIIAMLATAVVATLLRLMDEDVLMALADWENLLIYSMAALAASLGGILLLNSPIRLWRLGLFAASTLLISEAACWAFDDDDLHVFFISQSVTVAAALLIPRFDRYRMRLLVEPLENPPDQTETTHDQ